MSYCLNLTPLLPVRATPSEAAEMMTQLLYGDTCRLLQEQERWWRIRNDYDGYEGWVDRKILTPLTSEAYQARLHTPSLTVASATACVKLAHADAPLLLTLGSTVAVEDLLSVLQGEVVSPLPYSPDSVLAAAHQMLNAPYLWGGSNALGIDCSGLVQVTHRIHGVALPRDACQQAEVGTLIAPLSRAAAGDIAFFANDKGRVTHVGILVDRHTIIHASGQVRIDILDDLGIYHAQRRLYTHTLHSIRRMGHTLL